MKLPVLIYVGESNQLGKRMQFSPLSSLIRLEWLKPVDICGQHVLKEAMPVEVP